MKSLRTATANRVCVTSESQNAVSELEMIKALSLRCPSSGELMPFGESYDNMGNHIISFLFAGEAKLTRIE